MKLNKSVDSIKKIVTHAGKFHTDEVFAIAILKDLFPESIKLSTGKKTDFIKYIRERNPKALPFHKKDKSTILIDVGESYNPEIFNFDHHQKESAGKRENGVAYAAAGLIWKHFGKEWITYVDIYTRKLRLTESEKDLVWSEIDTTYVQLIDSNDTGQMEEVKYSLSGGIEIIGNQFTLTQIVRLGNIETFDGRSQQERFNEVLEILRSVIFSIIQKQFNLIEGLRCLDMTLLELSPDNRTMIVLGNISQEVLLYLLYSENKFAKVEFYACPTKKSDYSVNVVTTTPETREYRNPKMIPKEMRLSNNEKELNELLGVDDGMLFVHTVGFFAKCKNLETAKKLLEYCTK